MQVQVQVRRIGADDEAPESYKDFEVPEGYEVTIVKSEDPRFVLGPIGRRMKAKAEGKDLPTFASEVAEAGSVLKAQGQTLSASDALAGVKTVIDVP